jgi:hypothetical protein
MELVSKHRRKNGTNKETRKKYCNDDTTWEMIHMNV